MPVAQIGDMGNVDRRIDPASPIWITPTVLGSCLALVVGYALYTYKKELPLPPVLPGAAAAAAAPAPRPISDAPDNSVYFFFTKVNDLDYWYTLFPVFSKLAKRDADFNTVMANIGIFFVLALVAGLVITEITLVATHTIIKPLSFSQNVGAQVASALTLCLLLAVLFYKLRDSSLTPILYMMSISFLMILGAVISSQTQVNVQ